MNKTLLTVLCASTIALGAVSVNAAEREMLPPPPPGHEFDHPGRGPKFDHKKHKEMGEKFAKELGLTEEQKAQADKIREEGREKLKPIMKEMKALREKADKMREENMKEFEKILTPEQKAKMEKMKADRKAEHEKRKIDRKMKKHDAHGKKDKKD